MIFMNLITTSRKAEVNMKKKLLGIILCMSIGVSTVYSAGVEITKSDSGVTFKDTPEAGERISITIAKPSYNVDSLNEDNYGSHVYFADFINPISGNFEKFVSITGTDYGIYDIRTTKIKPDGSVEVTDSFFNHINPQDMIDCVETFKTVTAENFYTEWTLWKDTKSIITENTLLIDSSNGADIGNYFEYLRDNRDNTALSYDFSSVGDVEKMARRAYGFYLMDTNADYNTYIQTNPITDITNGADIDEYATMYNAVKSNITDKDSFLKTALQIGVLCKLQNANREVAETVMRDNATLFGLELTYASDRNVSLANIAMHLDVSDTVKWFGDKLNTEFKRIVDVVVAGRNNNPTELGGSGGGGGGVGLSVNKKPEGTVQQSNDVTDPNTPVQNTPVVDTSGYSDMSGYGWASEAVGELSRRGIINGNGDGNYEPERRVTREEFVKLVVNAFGLTGEPKAEISFKDMASDDWFYPYILIAHSNSVISGINEELFGVSQSLTRQDSAVILYNAAKAKKFTLSASLDNDSFKDGSEIADYAERAVASLAKMGCITGFEDGSFRPYGNATRAEAAVMIYRIMEIFELL